MARVETAKVETAEWRAGEPGNRRRVRDEVRASVAVAATSVAASLGLVAVAALVLRLAG